MTKSWFHSILDKEELEYRCRLSNSMDSLGPLENTSEYPVLKATDKNGSSSESSSDSSNADSIKEKEETDAVKDKEKAEKFLSDLIKEFQKRLDNLVTFLSRIISDAASFIIELILLYRIVIRVIQLYLIVVKIVRKIIDILFPNVK